MKLNIVAVYLDHLERDGRTGREISVKNSGRTGVNCRTGLAADGENKTHCQPPRSERKKNKNNSRRMEGGERELARAGWMRNRRRRLPIYTMR